jgi:hypothetical protein
MLIALFTSKAFFCAASLSPAKAVTKPAIAPSESLAKDNLASCNSLSLCSSASASSFFLLSASIAASSLASSTANSASKLACISSLKLFLFLYLLKVPCLLIPFLRLFFLHILLRNYLRHVLTALLHPFPQ